MLLHLKFDSKSVREPVISKTTLEKNTLINIIRGSVGAREGELVVEIDDSRSEEIISYIKEKGVEVTKIMDRISKDEDKCVHCGACVSICPVEVFEIEDFKIQAIQEKCIRCGICVDVCPLGALELPRF